MRPKDFGSPSCAAAQPVAETWRGRGFGGGGECVMKAVLWDMDGTLVDSEKLWDVSLAALYEKLGGELTPAVRASMVGSVAENTMRIVYTDLGLEPRPRRRWPSPAGG